MSRALRPSFTRMAVTCALLVAPLGVAHAYTENFSSGSAGWTAAAGTWAVNASTYYSTAIGENDLALYNSETWSTNFTYQLDVKNEFTSSGNRGGPVYNYVDANNYYRVEFAGNGSPGTVNLVKRVAGVETTTSSTYPVGPNTWFTVAVIRSGTLTTVRVNGTDVFTNVAQSELGTGKIGLYTKYANMRFDNLSVTATGGDVTPPSAPASPTANVVSSSQINLSWTASTDDTGVTGYIVERCQGSGCSNFAQIATPTGASYSDTGLAASTAYSYRIRARDAANNQSAYSSTASGTTLSASGGYSQDFSSGTATGWSASAGTWSVTGGYYASTAIGEDDLTIYSDGVWTGNITYQASIYNEFTASGNRAALVYNYIDANNYYRVEFDGAGPPGTAKLVKRVAGVETTSNASFNAGPNTWFTATVVRTGTSTTVKVNNVDIFAAVTQSEFTTGKVGLYTKYAVARFDNITVTGSGGGGGDVTAPTAPTGASATAASASQINVSWTASTDNVGVTGYQIERCQGSGCSSFALVSSPTNTSFSDTGLSASTSYSYRIRARDAAGNWSTYSSVVSATTSASSGSGYTQDFSGGAASWSVVAGTWAVTSGYYYSSAVGEYDLAVYNGSTWSTDFTYQASLYNEFDNTGNRGGLVYNYVDVNNFYRVEFDGAASGTAHLVKRIAGVETETMASFNGGGTGTLFTAQVVRSGTSTTVKVNGVNVFTSVTQSELGAGKIGLFTKYAQFRFDDLSVAGAGGGDVVAPTVPSGASASAQSASQITVSWTASTDNVGVSSYRVERCAGASCSNFTEVGAPTGTAFVDTGLAASTTYQYRVRARDAAGNNSGYSATVSATTSSGTDTQPPGTTSGLTVTPGTTSMQLSWSAATDNVGVTGYLIERCQGNGCSNFQQIGTSTGTTYLDTGLLAGVTYSYRVRARDAAGNNGGYSNNGAGVMGQCD